MQRLPQLLRSLFLAAIGLCASASLTAEPDVSEWPYPEDIPVASSAAPGLAGELPYDIVRFLMTRGPTNVSLSPDGRYLAYRSTATGKPQLYTFELGAGTPEQITFGRAVTSYAWAPTGDRLLYAADRDGNEREGYTLITPDGRQEQQLSRSSSAFLNFGGFSRDGSAIAYATTERNGVDFDVFVQEIESGDVRRVFEGTFGFYARGWAADGRHLLMSETRGEDGNNLYLLDTESGEAETLFKPAVSSEYQNFAWKADGSGFYLNTNHDREFHALAFYDLSSGELQFLDTPDHDVDNVVLFAGDRYLAWTVNEGGYDRLRIMALTGSDAGVAADGPALPSGVYDLSGARDAATLAIRISGPRTPGEVWLWQPEAAAAERIVNATLAGLDPTLLSEPDVVSFEARDGVALHGLLYRPENTGTRAPLMLKVHGGPTGQARPRFDAVAQYLVGRGYAVFDFNFRGSTGYGKSFARLDNGRLRPDAVGDIQDAVEWLGDNAEVDPTRMAIMGGSYGGYLTNAAVGSYPGLFKAAVSFVGVSDWVRALEEASPALKASDRVEYGDINDPDDRAFFAEISPLSRAHLVRTPMLVVHGANDPRDPVGESDRFVQAVREQEVEVRYLRFADEGHGLRKIGNRITAYREIADFLDAKLN